MKQFSALVLFILISVTTYALTPITGPVSCCLGASVTLKDAETGGTWASSNPRIASVNSHTGMVTGVSEGIADITYTLGANRTFIHFTVYTWPGAGMITGSDNVIIGSSVILTNPKAVCASHYWTSCAPEIASVNYETGAVKGISAGATTITYSALGCGGMAYTTLPVYVTPADCISGHVNFPGGYNGKVKVSLIHFSSARQELIAVDSAIYTCTDSTIFYQFTGIPTDSFRVKASVLDTMSYRYGFNTTYHYSNYLWFNGNLIQHYAGSADVNKDINMIYARFQH